MNMNIDDIEVFVAAVSAGSLAGAARRLGLTPMVATRRLSSLETDLGIRLLHRTTRSLALTPEGETFLPYAEALLETKREALTRLRSETGTAVGLLRVSAPGAFGVKFIAPFIPKLLEENPEMRISLDLTDSLPDLVATGTDLAIRITRLRDSSLIAQKLADSPRVLAASPEYAAKHGLPATTGDLAQHSCLPLTGTTHWRFLTPAGERQVRLGGHFSSSSIQGCHAACLAGGGIVLLSAWYLAEDISAGRLICFELEDATPEPFDIWAVYPTTRLMPQKVRVFIAHLREALTETGLRM
ncbi:LysR family transcriptional regulator [Brucella endophytica]|uniref:LysR family transcriptional regulator n=1 Tax=Brucella endophytica TaxID=1963359 RepID=A0A916S777_9HYPH|nr:LysR family transcriptional regulator [Brucella endophytica]GGA87972.1 LysR family transcriptional regulator [Brucella endophytica]